MKINLNDKLIFILNILFSGIFVSTLLGLKKVELVLYISIVPFIATLWMNNLKNENNKLKILSTILIIFSLFNVIINSLNNTVIISFNYYKKIIMFSMTIMYFSTVCNAKINVEFIKKQIKILNTIIILLCVLLFKLKNTDMYIYNGKIIHSLCFNFTNPNLTALFLSSLFIFDFTFFMQAEKKISKMIYLILGGIVMYFIYLTDSRTSVFACIVYTLISFLLKKTNVFKNKLFLIVVTIFPFVFAILYMMVINNLSLLKQFEKLPLLNDGIDSRVYIWNKAYDNYIKSPIVGAYYEISDGTGQSQMHNTHVDILSSYGIIPFVLFLRYLYKIMKDNKSSDNNYIYSYGFLAFVLLGCGEASLFSGSVGLFIYVGNLLLLSRNYKLESQKEEI